MPKFRALNCSKRSVRFQVLAPCSAAASQEDLQGEYFQFSSCIPSVFIIITPRAGNTGQIPIRLSEENNITIIIIIGGRHGLVQPCSPRLQSKLPDVAQRAAELQSSESGESKSRSGGLWRGWLQVSELHPAAAASDVTQMQPCPEKQLGQFSLVLLDGQRPTGTIWDQEGTFLSTRNLSWRN